jgi:ech hydrogenase subunit C
VYVPGCAARPESIIDGIVKALVILDEKRATLAGEAIKEERFRREEES